eukprot:766428-Hanusia_phi.AAC.17
MLLALPRLRETTRKPDLMINSLSIQLAQHAQGVGIRRVSEGMGQTQAAPGANRYSKPGGSGRRELLEMVHGGS